MRRGVLIIVLVAAALVIRGGQSLTAYVTNGYAWGVTSVPFYVNPNSQWVSPNAAITALQTASFNWASQSNANVSLVYAGTTTGTTAQLNYKNEVFFRPDSNGSYAAVTYWWYDGTGHLVDADIVFYEGSYVFFTGTTGCQGNGEYLEDVGTHEFGHVLGMAHSLVTTATMYATNTYCDESWRTLDPDDVTGIESLYPPVQAPQPPATPTQLAVGNSTTSSLGLTWVDNSTNESGYRVDQSPDGSSWSQIAQLGVGAKSYTATGLAAATSYSFRVSAYNAGGASGYSNTATGVTQTPPSPTPPPTPTPTPTPTPSPTPTTPSVPSGPSPSNGANGVSTNVNLAWAASSQAQQYDVYFGTSTSPALYASNLTSTSKALPTLAAGTTYYWKVVAKNTAGSSSGSVWKFTTKNGKGK